MPKNLPLIRKPLVLEPVEHATSWGSETWLSAVRVDGRALIPPGENRATLAEFVESHPEMVGRWSRLLFGDRLPIFAKFLRTRFPSFVHIGFRVTVDKDEFLSWLEREQALLGELYDALAVRRKPDYVAFQRAYEQWAVTEAMGRWVSDDRVSTESFGAAILPLLRRPLRVDPIRWAEAVKANRAGIVAVLNEVDLEGAQGNLLLVGAGTPHAIFGLSLQTHPPDHSRSALEKLFGEFGQLLASGASEKELEPAALRADLPSARAKNPAPPKSEAWLPLVVGKETILVEPQQTSDVTLSFADFYTPFTWKGHFIFRKGRPEKGLSRGDLEACLASLDFSPTPLDTVLRRAVAVASLPGSLRSGGFWVLRDPGNWPFFTAREVVLTGSPRGLSVWREKAPDGSFQLALVLEGTVDLLTEGDELIKLSTDRPAFIPATMEGGYQLVSRGAARVLFLSVPVPSDLLPVHLPATTVPGRAPTFLDKIPVPLAFGTSGLRGLVKDITDLEAYVNTKGFLKYALKTGDVKPAGTVVVAGDLRPSTDRIMKAVARAALDTGLRVENAGTIPTPALIYHAMQSGHPSIMVTGSHIPFDRNGIKFNKSTGEVLKSDEADILKEVAVVRREEYARGKGETPFDSGGMLGKASSVDLPPPVGDARKRYVRRYLDLFPRDGLKGRRIVVYQHSAVGRDILMEVLGALGAEVVPAGRSEEFVSIDTENVTEDQLDRLDAMARDCARTRGSADGVISTDGDSDRPLLAAVMGADRADEKGRTIRFFGGDLIGVVVAAFLKADAAAVPISANDAVDKRLDELGVKLVKTRIGSPYVIQAMQELEAGGGYRRCVSWEANGGFLTGTDLSLYGGVLKALPTRDALLPLLCVLFASGAGKGSIADLFARLPKRYRIAGLLDNFPTGASRKMKARLSPSSPGVIEASFSPENITVRDNEGIVRTLAPTDPLAVEMEEKRERIARYFTRDLGFGSIKAVNFLDGVRVTFDNGDIAHMRPSGNAPQLRIYATSDTTARAAGIAALCLKDPGGIFRRMEAELAK